MRRLLSDSSRGKRRRKERYGQKRNRSSQRKETVLGCHSLEDRRKTDAKRDRERDIGKDESGMAADPFHRRTVSALRARERDGCVERGR